MRVLNVNQNHHIRGGSDVYYFALTKLLEEHGHDVIPFAADHEKNTPSTWRSHFPPPVNFEAPSPSDLANFLYSRRAAAAISRIIKDASPDLAHLHIYYGQLTASILGPLKQRGTPIVQTLHEYKIVCPTSHLIAKGAPCEACKGKYFWNATLKRCNRNSLLRSSLSALETQISRMAGSVSKIDHFIAVSDFLRDKVISLGVSPAKITTIHNFVDPSKFTPGTEPGSYFLYFGRLERIKGIFTLAEAMSKVPTARLYVAGTGNDKEALEEYIKTNKVSNVHLLGFKSGDELHDLIRGSICTICPSEWHETFGLTLLESFALGRPVICTRMGGMTEVVTDEVDGFVLPPADAEILAERIGWLHKNPVAAAKMGVNGRKKIEKSFTAAIHYEKLKNIYRAVNHGVV